MATTYQARKVTTDHGTYTEVIVDGVTLGRVTSYTADTHTHRTASGARSGLGTATRYSAAIDKTRTPSGKRVETTDMRSFAEAARYILKVNGLPQTLRKSTVK